MLMEPACSVNPSHWEVNDKQTFGCMKCIPFLLIIFTVGAPQHPQVVTVTPVNSTTVTLSWSEVQCFNRSGAVTHYLVQYQSLCGGVVQNVTTSGTVQTVSSLRPNCVYTFQVAAVGTGNKIGSFSNPVNASLPGECKIADC